ncbi:hypothetical protein [Jannaschia seosinensis]|uniref:hypothetical protein n=1 Tax=Jannaschia seosinensis TaxID=313367 RepID=UPI0011873B62|nr:hypothetical protein [Jannaschia seosinensis]
MKLNEGGFLEVQSPAQKRRLVQFDRISDHPCLGLDPCAKSAQGWSVFDQRFFFRFGNFHEQIGIESPKCAVLPPRADDED